jgi:hypothetical protein
MKLKKLYALLLIALTVIQMPAAVRRSADDGAIKPEPTENAVKLLNETVSGAHQLIAPENRIHANTILAGLLWKTDERAARELYQRAAGELQNLFAAIDQPEGLEGMTRLEKSEHYGKRSEIAALRRELILSLGERDPQAAIEALGALKVNRIVEYDPLAANELELQLTTAVARKDPEKAAALAKRKFDENGLNYQFVQSLKELHGRDSGAAAQVAREMLTKIKPQKIRFPLDTDKPSTPLKAGEIDYWELGNLINAAFDLNRTAERDKEKKMKPLLTAEEMKELVELAANSYLTTPNPMPLSISHIMTEINRYSPALAPKVRAKMGAENAVRLDAILESRNYDLARNEKSLDELVKDAERAAPQAREQRLAELALKALEEKDAVKAQEIFARLKEPKNYSYLSEEIGAALPLAKAVRGGAAEVRRVIAGMRNNLDKINALTDYAVALAARGEKPAAKELLDEAAAMLPRFIRKFADVEASIKFASVAATIAPEQSFAVLENAVAQSDEYINAGIKLGDFFTVRAAEQQDELLFSSISSQYLMWIPNSSVLLRDLARADFERTVGLADKFQRPEIRLFMRLRVLEAMLDENAAEKEKSARDQLEGDGEV